MSDKDLDSDLEDDGVMDTDDKVVDSETEKQLLSGSSAEDESSASDSNADDEDAEMDAEDAAHSRLLQKYFETLEKINHNKYSYDDYVVLVNLAV